MKRIGLYLLLAVVAQSCCVAHGTKMTAVQRKVLEDSAHFDTVLATTNLPPAIVALCADDNGRLAEPGQKWEATDNITDASLPRKRLIWAAVSGKHYVVHYERGGRGHSFHVLVATLTKGDATPKVIWIGSDGPLKDYSAFVGAWQKGKLYDASDSAH